MALKTYSKADLKAPVAFDDYEFAVDELENGLKVLYVSSDKVDRAAVAIGCGVGSMWDFPHAQGVAHFCEHMLFMGTAKFPSEEEYQTYVQQNGGMTNAFTAESVTCYYATVKTEALEGLIDRTTEFFVSPAFKESCVDREVEAVNSEHEKNLQSDERRKYHLMKMLANPKHPFNKFSTGSNETLRRKAEFGDDTEKALKQLRNALIEFHDKYYDSNNMSACIVGRESIDELRKMSEERLNKIKRLTGSPDSKGEVIPVGGLIGLPEKMFGPTELTKLVDIVPVKAADRKLEFKFLIPDQRDFYREKPGNFISHFLGYEGPGSILSRLKELHICTGLFAGVVTENCGNSIFAVGADIVNDEVFSDQNIIYIGKLIFAVVRRYQIMEQDRLKELVDDEVALNYIQWRYRPMLEVSELVREGVCNLLTYESNEVFDASYITMKVDIECLKSQMQNILDQADSLHVWRTTTKYAEKCMSTEKFYGTKYCMGELPAAWRKEWQHAVTGMSDKEVMDFLETEHIDVLKKNKFVPKCFDLKGDCTDVLAAPNKLSDSPIEIWHKRETSFKLPHFVFVGRIIMPVLLPSQEDLKYMRDTDVTAAKMKQKYSESSKLSELPWPARVALVYAYQKAIMESVNESMYDARLAGVAFSVGPFNGVGKGPVGLAFELGGFDDKGVEIMATLIDNLTQFNVSDTHLKTALVDLVRAFTNKTVTADPYIYVMNKASELTTEGQWDDKCILAALEKLTPELTRKFITVGGGSGDGGKKLVPELYMGSKVFGAIVGNVTEDEVKQHYADPAQWKRLIPEGDATGSKAVKLTGDGRVDLQRIDYTAIAVEKYGIVKAEGNSAGKPGEKLQMLVVKIPTPNNENPNNAVALNLQSVDGDYKTYAFNNVLSIWIGDKFFDDLRTKQSLGYVVGTPTRENGARLIRTFLAQSTRSPEFVLSRMLNFLGEKCVELGENGVGFKTRTGDKLVGEEEFEKCKAAVISRIEEKPKELCTLCERAVTEVITQRYDFDRRDKQLEYLHSYTRDAFAEDLARAVNLPWLAVLAYNEKSEPVDIDAIEEFKTFYPWCALRKINDVRDIIYDNCC